MICEEKKGRGKKRKYGPVKIPSSLSTLIVIKIMFRIVIGSTINHTYHTMRNTTDWVLSGFQSVLDLISVDDFSLKYSKI